MNSPFSYSLTRLIRLTIYGSTTRKSYIAETAVLKFYSGTTSNYTTTSLENASSILNTSFFNKDWPTLCYIFGYTGQPADYTATVIQAILDLKDRNVCLMDWEQEANSYLGPIVNIFLQPLELQAIGINYPVVCGLLEKVAINVGQALLKMSKNGFNMDTFHCVGHSLGGQMCGAIGRQVKKGNMNVRRITSLDPASVCFQEPTAFLPPVGKDCAIFVNNIHTDPGKYGLRNSTGHMDIWVNYEYYMSNKVQPGCKKGSAPLTVNSFCSHVLSRQLLVESLKNPTSLIASKANSSADWTNGMQENSTTYIGDLVNTNGTGDYFLCTNVNSPYGQYLDGINPKNCPQ